MISKKRCENCINYQKLDTFGLCMDQDGRVNCDPSFRCKKWKGIKYSRHEFRKNTTFELKISDL